MKQLESQLDLDLYPAWQIPSWHAWWLALAAAVVAIVAILVWFKTRKPAVVETLDKKSILQELKDLEVPKTSCLEEKKRFYFRLVGLLKQLFQFCQDEELDGKTETELLKFAEERFGSMSQELKPVINNAVWVKYSKDDLYTQMTLDRNIIIKIATRLENNNGI